MFVAATLCASWIAITSFDPSITCTGVHKRMQAIMHAHSMLLLILATTAANAAVEITEASCSRIADAATILMYDGSSLSPGLQCHGKAKPTSNILSKQDPSPASIHASASSELFRFLDSASKLTECALAQTPTEPYLKQKKTYELRSEGIYVYGMEFECTAGAAR